QSYDRRFRADDVGRPRGYRSGCGHLSRTALLMKRCCLLLLILPSVAVLAVVVQSGVVIVENERRVLKVPSGTQLMATFRRPKFAVRTPRATAIRGHRFEHHMATWYDLATEVLQGGCTCHDMKCYSQGLGSSRSPLSFLYQPK